MHEIMVNYCGPLNMESEKLFKYVNNNHTIHTIMKWKNRLPTGPIIWFKY